MPVPSRRDASRIGRTRRSLEGRWLRAALRGPSLSLTAVLLGCAAAPPPPALPPPTPAVWEARGEGAGGCSLALLGSVHMGTSQGGGLGPTVEAAYRRAEEIVVEVDLAATQEAEVQALTARYGVLEPPAQLSERISEETHRLLVEWLETHGLPLESFESFKPWLVTFLLVQLDLQSKGYEQAHGVDRRIIWRAAGRKPIVALETAAGQLRMFDDLPAPLQDLMLRDALERAEEDDGEVEALFDAWRRGDAAALAELLFGILREHPEFAPFYERVYFERNDQMARKLATLCRDGRPRLVVVGAGHVVGERGVPRLLAERGFRVRRIFEASELSSGAGAPGL